VIDVVLGIETSCDETSAAVLVRHPGGPRLASLVILSQDIHTVFGGVVPELASRAHLTALSPVVARALQEAGVPMERVDAIAVTQGPGLIGSLLVGLCYAKALATAQEKALIGVHHLEGHLFAPTLEVPDLTPPFVALLVSGGHTLLLDVRQWGQYELLGSTRDDAAGEAFDKVATMLGLGYPGGPAVERTAASGDPGRYDFPRPMLHDGFDFSFSGLKTAVLHAVRTTADVESARPDLAASFQAAAFDVLEQKAEAALHHTGHHTLVLGGGVACSRTLCGRMQDRFGNDARVVVASPRLNTDNAAMIARAGWFHLERGARSSTSLGAHSRLRFPGLRRPASPVSAAS